MYAFVNFFMQVSALLDKELKAVFLEDIREEYEEVREDYYESLQVIMGVLVMYFHSLCCHQSLCVILGPYLVRNVV